MTGAEDQLQLVNGLYRVTNQVVRVLDQHLIQRHGTTFVQALTLSVIRSFERAQPNLVAEVLGQQSQTITGVIDRLERAGHLKRRRDLTDRRAVRIELTASGARLAGEVSETLSELGRQLLGGVDAARQARMSEDIDSLLRSLSPEGFGSTFDGP